MFIYSIFDQSSVIDSTEDPYDDYYLDDGAIRHFVDVRNGAAERVASLFRQHFIFNSSKHGIAFVWELAEMARAVQDEVGNLVHLNTDGGAPATILTQRRDQIVRFLLDCAELRQTLGPLWHLHSYVVSRLTSNRAICMWLHRNLMRHGCIFGHRDNYLHHVEGHGSKHWCIKDIHGGSVPGTSKHGQLTYLFEKISSFLSPDERITFGMAMDRVPYRVFHPGLGAEDFQSVVRWNRLARCRATLYEVPGFLANEPPARSLRMIVHKESVLHGAFVPCGDVVFDVAPGFARLDFKFTIDHLTYASTLDAKTKKIISLDEKPNLRALLRRVIHPGHRRSEIVLRGGGNARVFQYQAMPVTLTRRIVDYITEHVLFSNNPNSYILASKLLGVNIHSASIYDPVVWRKLVDIRHHIQDYIPHAQTIELVRAKIHFLDCLSVYMRNFKKMKFHKQHAQMELGMNVGSGPTLRRLRNRYFLEV